MKETLCRRTVDQTSVDDLEKDDTTLDQNNDNLGVNPNYTVDFRLELKKKKKEKTLENDQELSPEAKILNQSNVLIYFCLFISIISHSIVKGLIYV